ncbi:uncharacterized protein VTP21DRAFT_6598 [Calcarisporiella thermophila]|uniref:uncharacterized protein n=1 Tax=Calcarisporiella thermophila TaxID=911321 RepID=UPI003743B2DE
MARLRRTSLVLLAIAAVVLVFISGACADSLPKKQILIKKEGHESSDSSKDVATGKSNDPLPPSTKSDTGLQLYNEARQLLRGLKRKYDSSHTTKKPRNEQNLVSIAIRMVTNSLLSLFSFGGGSRNSVSGERKITGGFLSAVDRTDPFAAQQEKLEKVMDMLSRAGKEHGNDEALMLLGDLHFYAFYGNNRNLTAAFECYTQLADRSGFPSAQNMIGFMYATGVGGVVKADQAKALLYYTFAAMGGDPAAQMSVGYRQLMGIGTKSNGTLADNCQNAVIFYQKAAEKAIAHFKAGPPLGRTLPPEKIRLSDSHGGVYGYGAGSANDLVDSLHTPGFLDYHYGVYGDRTDKEAIRNQLIFGLIYYSGTHSIPRNYQKAYEIFSTIAKRYFGERAPISDPDIKPNKELSKLAGHAAAFLGKMYWRGEGVPQNNLTAFQWFILGAIEKNEIALNALGQMYLEGTVDAKDKKKAIGFFKEAAEKNNPDAQVNLGLLYLEEWKQFRRDSLLQNAFLHFTQAAKPPYYNLLGQFYLAEMLRLGLGTSKNCHFALLRYKQVAERGDWHHSPFEDAHQAYLEGDKETAVLLYMLAAERGYELAQANVAWLLDPGNKSYTPES